MIIPRKYSVLFLIFLLLAPLIYQSVHILHHHSHKGAEEFCLNIIFNDPDELDNCFVCNFQFISYYASFRRIIISIEQIISDQIITTSENYYLAFSDRYVSLRAPPFQS